MRTGLTQAEDVATSLPFAGRVIAQGRQRALQEQNLGIINKALEPVGIKLDKTARAGHEAVDEAYTKLSDKYDTLLDNASIKDVSRAKANADVATQDLLETVGEPAIAKFQKIIDSAVWKNAAQKCPRRIPRDARAQL